MITDFLLDHPVLVPVGFVLIAVAGVAVGYLLLRAGRRMWWLVVLSVLPVLVLTLRPVLGRSFVFCVVQFSVPSLGSVELLANVALFFPPVFFATLATRRPLLMLAAGSGLSAVIEVLQGLVPAIGRACDTNDWMMNTAGALIGVLLASGTIALANRTAVARA